MTNEQKARVWLYENTNDGDPQFEARCASLAALLDEVVTDTRARVAVEEHDRFIDAST